MGNQATRFKLTLHYDGSDFHGWQIQPREATVQGALEAVVSRLTGEHRTVLGAGRTDTGVHATGQVAAVTMPAPWTAPELIRSLNAMLPRTIWVRDAQPIHDSFDPRREAILRSYRYRVGTAPHAASPFHRRWCWPLCRPLDMDAAARAARLLIGEHEFRAFAKTGQPQRGYTCRVATAGWRPWGDEGVVFEISANRFLHRMVRYLAGTMVDIALKRRREEDMALLLSGETRPGTPPTGLTTSPTGLTTSPARLTTSPPAPAQGLCLTRVEYPDHATVASTVPDM